MIKEYSNNSILRIINKIELNYRDLLIFLIPCIIFGIYLYVFNPGIIYFDTYYQFHQIATNNLNNWHSVFHTFIEMVFLKIFDSPLAISIFQILTFSVMWMVICKYHRNDNSKKSFILQIIVTLVISLIPLNAVFSILLYKDILFSYFLMFLCFLIKVVIDKKGKINLSLCIFLAITMAFVAQLRPNGMIIVLFLLILLFIYFFKNNKKQKYHFLIPIMTITFILLISSLNVVYDVEDIQKDSVLSKSSHMLIDYEINHLLNNEDSKKLDELMGFKTYKENFQLTLSDPTYPLNNSAYENNKFTYFSMALEYSFKNPKHCIKYLLGSSPIVWKIIKEDNWSHYEGLDTYLTSANTAYYAHTKEVPVTTYDNATFKNKGTPEFDNLCNFLKYISSNKVLDALFDSPALYMYLSLILLCLMHIITKSKDLWFVYLPNFLNIVIIFFSMPAPQIRYLYPNFLVFYLLVIIVIGKFVKKETH